MVIQTDMHALTEYLAELEEKVYKSNKISHDLLMQIKQAELEIEQLHGYVESLKKSQNVYLPYKKDDLD
jgi:pyrroloquinoline quinone (PQQ) biosynthesis protein C